MIAVQSRPLMANCALPEHELDHRGQRIDYGDVGGDRLPLLLALMVMMSKPGR